MAQGNLEKFIVDLGFSDKNAVKGLKAFIAKVDKMKANIQVAATGKVAGKAGSKDLSETILHTQDAHISAYRKSQNKLDGIHAKAIIENNKRDAQAKANLLKNQSNVKEEQATQDAHIKALHRYRDKLDKLHTQAIIEDRKRARTRPRGKTYNGKEFAADFTSSRFGFNLMQDSPEKFNQARQHLETFKGTTAQARRYVNDLKNAEMVLRKNNAHLKKGNMLQRGLSDSTRNMVRSYASVFALFSTASYINTSGQTMEGVVAGMTAVSKSSQEAESNLRFLREEGQRLGLDIGESSKAFVKLRAAIGDKATIEETRKAFTNLSEAGVVYQVSQADMAGTIRAVQQMFSKSGIMAEEFKTQLGDRIPTAMVALEKSTGKTAKELLKMMEMGQLGVEYINPFLTALGELANKNGALEKSLKTTATAQRQFNTELKLAGDTVYKEGFGEGFGDLLRDLIESLKESQGGLEGLGKTFQAFFNTIRAVANFIIPIFNSLFTVTGALADAFNYAFGNETGNKILGAALGIGAIVLNLRLATKAAMLFGIQLKIALAPLLAILAVAHEIYGFFDDKTTNYVENLTGTQGWKSINPFSQANMKAGEAATKNAHLQYSSLQASSPRVEIINNTYVDGVKKSVEGQMQIDYSQAMVGGR